MKLKYDDRQLLYMLNTIQETEERSIFGDVIALIEAGVLVPGFDQMNFYMDTFFKTLGDKVLIAKGKARQYIPKGALEMWLVAGYHLVKDEAKLAKYLETPFLTKLECVSLILGHPTVPVGVRTRGFVFQTATQELIFKWNADGILAFALMFLAEGDELEGGTLGREDLTSKEDAKRILDTLRIYGFDFSQTL